MKVRRLKAKRVERGFLQKDLAEVLRITEKAMCQKECSTVNRFKVQEMLILASALNLTMDEFDDIFFDHKLTYRLISAESPCRDGPRTEAQECCN